MLFWFCIKRTGCRGIVRRNPCLCPVLEKDGEKEGLGARVYKISRDEQGNRLTHLKILSGILKVKDTISGKQGKKRSTRSGSIPEVNMRRSARRNRAVSVQ